MSTVLDRLADGKKHVVSQTDYENFLDVLPPVCVDMLYQGERWDFGFAEGADRIRLFRKQGASYYAIETPYINPFEAGSIELQKRRWVVGWIELGRKTRALHRARDTLLTPHSFQECGSDAELLAKVDQPHWPAGQAFFVGDLCFVNLANERGEWLALKEGTVLQTVSFRDIIDVDGMDAAQKVIDDLRAFRIFLWGRREGRGRR